MGNISEFNLEELAKINKQQHAETMKRLEQMLIEFASDPDSFRIDLMAAAILEEAKSAIIQVNKGLNSR